MRLPLIIALSLVASTAVAQEPVHRMAAPSVATGDLTALSDEFNGDSLNLGRDGWTRFDQAYGWPDKIRTLDVGRSTPGVLRLAPHDAAWVRDLNAPFLFRVIQGDFDVRARLRVKGEAGDVPGGTWSLGGLMARVPNGLDAAGWRPRMENWHFITTGVGHVPGQQMTETKGTYNSWSSLKLRPFATGWVELRMVRVGVAMVVLARADGETRWQVRDRFYRMNAPAVTEVGLIAYTTSPAAPPRQGPEDPVKINGSVDRDLPVDMVMDVDWIRFARPHLTVSSDWYGQVSANPLADPNLSEEAVLEMLGG